MFRGISNDQSLEDACPSLARASAAYRERAQEGATVGLNNSPLEKLRDALSNLGDHFASFLPGSLRPAEFACQLAGARPAMVEVMHYIAGAPERTARDYRLTDEAFDRLWAKALLVTETLDAVLLQGESSNGGTFGRLHARVLDATTELNRVMSRFESSTRAESVEEAETPVSEFDAREAAKELDEQGDDTSWTVRGL